MLEEVQGKRKLPIVIGMHEAQSIAIKLENMTPSRPLTHDLMQSLSSAFGITLKEVMIYDLVEGIFFARLVCEGDGKDETIDARTSMPWPSRSASAARFTATRRSWRPPPFRRKARGHHPHAGGQ